MDDRIIVRSIINQDKTKWTERKRNRTWGENIYYRLHAHAIYVKLAALFTHKIPIKMVLS